MCYNWALINTFSKYFAITVPFINCSTSIADNPEEGAIPITLSAYMSSLRNLCLANSKHEVKNLILTKTSVAVDKVPALTFERLKLQGQEESADTRKALENYELYHGLPRGTATVQQLTQDGRTTVRFWAEMQDPASRPSLEGSATVERTASRQQAVGSGPSQEERAEKRNFMFLQAYE